MASKASKKTLNAKNLQSLGVERLAELLIELSTGDTAMKRRLRMELAGAESPHALAKEIRKRLVTISRAKSFVDWHGIRALADDLDAQRSAIVEKVAKAEPQAAFELLWMFMALSNSIFERCHDSNGIVFAVFRDACKDLGNLAAAARMEETQLADRVYDAVRMSDYGQYDELIQIMAPALGQKGLEYLKGRIVDLSNTPVERPADKDRVKVGWSSSGPIYSDEMEENSRVRTVRFALKEIADAQGDADGFIAQYDKETRKHPKIAAEIARRLIDAGRGEEALATLEAAAEGKSDSWNWPDFEWEDAHIDVLESLGRSDDAQNARWHCFERTLSSKRLKAYLAKLPDFDDIEAEEKALDYASAYQHKRAALSFLVSWPSLDRAAQLVLNHYEELDGDYYATLTPAADALAGKHPLAATLLFRAMIDFTLSKARSKRYKHAARHFLNCASLSFEIEDFGAFETHETYETRLCREHGRKTSFWAMIN